MTTLAAFTVLLLAGLVSSASLNDDILTVTQEYFPESFRIYSTEHDIVNLICPLNSLNFDDEAGIESLDGNNIYVFFIAADVNNEDIDYKGLYVLRNRKATKLLDNGRDFAASSDNSSKVYFAATDGIYVYNSKENKAEKYGSLTDSLIGVAITTTNDLYVLSEDRVLYKVTEDGNKKERVPDVKDAVQIVLDFEDNMFFLNSKKRVYVKTESGIKKIKGTPANPSSAKLIRPPFALEEGVPFVAGKKVYGVYPNGTSEYENLILEARPSAYAIEPTLLQYYAYNKQIFEYNILAIVMGAVEMEELQTYFADKSDDIKMMGTKSRKSFRSK